MRVPVDPCFTGIYLVLTGIFPADAANRGDVDHSVRVGWHDLRALCVGCAALNVQRCWAAWMTGIIINDSIVLITSIDEYAKDRGLFLCD